MRELPSAVHIEAMPSPPPPPPRLNAFSLCSTRPALARPNLLPNARYTSVIDREVRQAPYETVAFARLAVV